MYWRNSRVATRPEATGVLVRIKTPELPLHLAEKLQRRDLSWRITAESDGMIAKGMTEKANYAFVVRVKTA